jgi:hypothetical protein
MKKILSTIVLIFIVTIVFGQQVQTIRGRVIDKDTQSPLPGAGIVLLNSSPSIGVVSDQDGKFRLEKIPLGRQGIKVSFIGYKPAVLSDLLLNSVKEVVLEIELEENVIQSEEVVIRGNARKDESINQMAVVSARTFTVEETEKYAGSRGDVARMAMNYAGVSSANDQRNDIVIRGNSPSGLLWRLEDVEIPNPNHFAEAGTTGGPVSMLNNNLLSNSDFFTGAFPAEYGNALSGVFDLNMRNGNNEKRESLFQVGFGGFELGTEGPLSKNHKASYLANFRYSTLELMDNLIDLGTTGVPKYMDFSFKLNFPMKKGSLTMFGIGGDSEIAILDSESEDTEDLYSGEGMDLYNRSRMGSSGIAYSHFLNDKTYYKLMLSGVYQKGGTQIDTLDDAGNLSPNLDHNYTDFKTTISGYINKKYNSHLTAKAGFSIDRMGYDLNTYLYNKAAQEFWPVVDDNRSLKDGVNLYRPYIQASYKFNDQLSIIPGIHLMYLDLNNSVSVEPRLGINWQFAQNQKLSLGYGRHSQNQTLYTYFLGTYLTDGSLIQTNKELDFTKSDQVVLGYNISINNHTRFKAEAYYQNIFDVPVEKRATSFSMLNTGDSWGASRKDSLYNGGTGRNYGLELTLERFFNKGLYYLATLSLFDSKYKGSDGIERNTAFNNNYVLNTLVGKEFKLNAKSTLNIDFKLSVAGGKHYTPIDMDASQAKGETVYEDTKAYSLQFDPFLKADIKFGYKINQRRISQEWIFYIENFTNHKNILMQNYSPSKNEITEIQQLGFFPMMQYRLYF